MAHYSAMCVGGPLDGRRFDHDYHQFQYPANEPRSVFDFDPNLAPMNTVTTVRAGLYTYDQDDGRWHWKL